MPRKYASPEECEVNAARVRAYYATPRGKELARARYLRWQERQREAERQEAVQRWVQSVIHAEGRDTPCTPSPPD